jgi:hypothetical protein
MKMIGVRLPNEHIVLLKKVCKARGEDLSDFVRRAIYKELATLSFLPKEQKKALGLTRALFKSEQERKR